MQYYKFMSIGILSGLVMAASMGAGLLTPRTAAAMSIATCDFDGDRQIDTAQGDSSATVSGEPFAGLVRIYFGNGGYWEWHQESPGIPGHSEQFDLFGESVAAGYFDDDQYCDLAIGVPYEGINDFENAGRVVVLYGSANGFQTLDRPVQNWHQGSSGVPGSNETDDMFGESLAAGDFNGDGNDDLAIGVSDEDIGRARNAGRVVILFGSLEGLQTDEETPQNFHQNSPGISGHNETGDRFGGNLWAGDYNSDGFTDLEIGFA